jgi:hypothetical protein
MFMDSADTPTYGETYGETPQPNSGLGQRLIGIITYRAHIYREIAKDRGATGAAAAIVVVTSLLVGALNGLFFGFALRSPEFEVMLRELQEQYRDMGLAVDLSQVAAINPGVWATLFGIGFTLYGLFFWLAPAWLSSLAANNFFEEKSGTSVGEMLRVYGFVYLFSLLLLIPIPIPFIVNLVVLVLSMLGNMIGAREAGGLSTAGGILTVLFAFGVSIVLGLALYICFSLFAAMAMAGAAGA